jgi:hypothetical protein
MCIFIAHRVKVFCKVCVFDEKQSGSKMKKSGTFNRQLRTKNKLEKGQIQKQIAFQNFTLRLSSVRHLPDHLNVGLGYAVLHYSALLQSRVIKHNRLNRPMNPNEIFETVFC